MVKSTYFQFIIRTLILCVLVSLATFLIIRLSYVWGAIIVLLASICMLKLIHFFNANNRKITYVIRSLINEDFTLNFNTQKKGKQVSELDLSLEALNTKIQKMYFENETKERYYKELLKQAEIGVITVNSKGHILFANPKAESLLNYTPLNHIRQLHRVSKELYQILLETNTFNRRLVKLHNERQTKQLALKSSQIVLNEEIIQLITLQDIRFELEDKETDSWIKLIRVLTHEIMNGIAPIVSVSDSLLAMYKENNAKASIEKGLEVIKRQGNDLMHFVQSYRSFLNVAKPDKKVVRIDTLFERIRWLFQLEMESKAIQFIIQNSNKEATIFVDEQQFLQVLINLIKNSIEATHTVLEKKIFLKAFVNKGKTSISITDNGVGILKEEISQIFIPFFTTKEKGTGIGLSLSKQIVQLHGGSLEVFSVSKKETCFTIVLS